MYCLGCFISVVVGVRIVFHVEALISGVNIEVAVAANVSVAYPIDNDDAALVDVFFVANIVILFLFVQLLLFSVYSKCCKKHVKMVNKMQHRFI